jgi:hypothetical protein
VNDDNPIRHTVEVFLAKLELFRDGFLQAAVTPEQRTLAERFRDFVDTAEPSEIGKAALPAILRDYQAFVLNAPEMEGPEL